MTTHYPRKDLEPKAVNGTGRKLPGLDLRESIAHLHPLHRQRAIELHQQQLHSSLSQFTACTVPASCRARSRFLNLRDSVKRSPTKSTAKVVNSSQAANRPQVPWVPFTFCQVAHLHKVALDGREGITDVLSLLRVVLWF